MTVSNYFDVLGSGIIFGIGLGMMSLLLRTVVASAYIFFKG